MTSLLQFILGVPMFSRFLRTRVRGTRIAVFHQLHPDPMILEHDSWKLFLDNGRDGDIEARLRQRRLIVDTVADDDEESRLNVEHAMRKLMEPTILYLMLAQDCNFRCAYCPIPATADRLGKIRLKSEDAVAGLEMWARHLLEGRGADSYIIFYGGEPLLNIDVLKSTLNVILAMRGAGLFSEQVHLMLVTNGSMLNSEVIQLCLQHKVHVVVGLDGFRAQHDRTRRDAAGRDTFEDVVRSITSLVEAGIRVSVSTTASEDLAENLMSYEKWIREIGISGYGINLPKGPDLARKPVINALVDRARRQGADGFEFQTSKRFRALSDRDPYPTDCTCYGNQLVIRPNGTVSNCPFTEHDFGHVRELGDDFRIWNVAMVREWRDRSPAVRPDLDTFDAKALMSTGCAFDAQALRGSSIVTEDSELFFADAMLEMFIWDTSDKRSS